MISNRSLILILNCVFFFMGAALLGVGIWSQCDKNFATLWNTLDVSKVIDARALNGAGILLIISGCCSIIVSFIGMYGAWHKDRCFLTTYCLLTSIVLLMEVASAAVFISYQNQAKEKMEMGLNKTVEKINTDNDLVAQRVMDTVQSVFHCCGCKGPSDYLNITSQTSCETSAWTPENPVYYQNGCFMTIINYLNYHLPIVVTLAVSMIMFQIFVVVISIRSCATLRQEGYQDI